MNPYNMWREQSPRQILQLLKSHKDMNKDPDDEGEGKSKSSKKDYTIMSDNVKIPSWYTVPKGAKVYSADDVYQGDM